MNLSCIRTESMDLSRQNYSISINCQITFYVESYRFSTFSSLPVIKNQGVTLLPEPNQLKTVARGCLHRTTGDCNHPNQTHQTEATYGRPNQTQKETVTPPYNIRARAPRAAPCEQHNNSRTDLGTVRRTGSAMAPVPGRPPQLTTVGSTGGPRKRWLGGVRRGTWRHRMTDHDGGTREEPAHMQIAVDGP